MFNTKVETAPAQGIADAPLFIRCQHNERNTPGFYGAQLRNAQLPHAEQFQQQGLKSVVHLVQFVDEQDTGPFTLQRAQKGPGTEKLQRLIKLADGFLFVNSLVALQALNHRAGCLCNCVGQLRLPTARWSFQ